MKTVAKLIAIVFLIGMLCCLSCSTSNTANSTSNTADMSQVEQVSDAESAKSKPEDSRGSIMIQYGDDGRILQFVDNIASNIAAKPMTKKEAKQFFDQQEEKLFGDPITWKIMEFRGKIPKTVDIRQASDREQIVREFVNTLGSEAAIKKGIKFYDANMKLRFRYPKLSATSSTQP